MWQLDDVHAAYEGGPWIAGIVMNQRNGHFWVTVPRAGKWVFGIILRLQTETISAFCVVRYVPDAFRGYVISGYGPAYDPREGIVVPEEGLAGASILVDEKDCVVHGR